MPPSKKPTSEAKRPPRRPREQTAIRLNDLIPDHDVTGGRRTVFGSSGALPPPLKRKPPK